MNTLTEQTALRLASALERVADVLERGAVQRIVEDGERGLVADLIVGGPDALKAINKRNKTRKQR